MNWRCIFAGLHLRSIEEPNKHRMPAEQGGTERCNDNIGSRSVVLLPTCQTSYEYDAEYSRIESWLDENPEFVQDYFIRYGSMSHFYYMIIIIAQMKTCSYKKQLTFFSFLIFRKATRQLVDSWLISHANSGNNELPSPIHGTAPNNSSRGGSGATTPVR